MKFANVLLVVAGIALAWIAAHHTFGSAGPDAETRIPRQIPATLSGEVPAGYVIRQFDVDGMCCDSCAGKLYRSLASIEGVDKIAIDPLAGRVSTLVPEKLDVDLLSDALNHDKYTARAAE